MAQPLRDAGPVGLTALEAGDIMGSVISSYRTEGTLGKDRDRLLRDFKKSKYSRTLEETEALLRSFGFIERDATKEASVWQRGGVTLTLPRPKKTLLVPYVVLVIRKIEEAKSVDASEEKTS
jgi:hypothetical protein